MLKRQEKLKNQILKQAQEYRQQKAKRQQEKAAYSEPEPTRKQKPKKDIQDVMNSQDEDEDQKKQKEVMKRYYRNRYSSFLQALANKKSEEEKAQELKRIKDEKRKQKIKEKVLNQIKVTQQESNSDYEADASSSQIALGYVAEHAQSESMNRHPRRGSSQSLVQDSQSI